MLFVVSDNENVERSLDIIASESPFLPARALKVQPDLESTPYSGRKSVDFGLARTEAISRTLEARSLLSRAQHGRFKKFREVMVLLHDCSSFSLSDVPENVRASIDENVSASTSPKCCWLWLPATWMAAATWVGPFQVECRVCFGDWGTTLWAIDCTTLVASSAFACMSVPAARLA